MITCKFGDKIYYNYRYNAFLLRECFLLVHLYTVNLTEVINAETVRLIQLSTVSTVHLFVACV